MIRTTCLIGLLLLIFANINAQYYIQDDYSLIPYRKGSLWGFCDSNKRVLIKPAYDSVAFFKQYTVDTTLPMQKIALVYKSGKYGVINHKGTLLVPVIYEDALDNSYDKGNKGVLLKKGKQNYIFYPQSGKTANIDHDLDEERMEPLREARIDCEVTVKSLRFSQTAADMFTIYKSRWDNTGKEAWDSLVFDATEIRKDICSNELICFRRDSGWGAASIQTYVGAGIKSSILIQPLYDSLRRVSGNPDYAAKEKDGSWYLLWKRYVKSSEDDKYYLTVEKLGPFEDINDDVRGVDFLIKNNGKWGFFLYGTNISLLDKTRYNKYVLYGNRQLIAAFDKNDKLIGYYHYNTTRFWD